MNRTNFAACPTCFKQSYFELGDVHCEECSPSGAYEKTAVVAAKSLTWLKIVNLLLFFIGLPIGLIFGVKLTNKPRFRLFGALVILILLMGRLGIGMQLAGTAVLVALAIA